MKRFKTTTALALVLALSMPSVSVTPRGLAVAYPASEAKILNSIGAFIFTRLLIRIAWRGAGKAVERAIIRRVSAWSHDPNNIRLILRSLEEVVSSGGQQAMHARRVIEIIEKMPLARANPYATKVPLPGQMINASNFWTKFVNFGRTRVYQGRDIFDPHAVIDGVSNLQRMQKGLAPLGRDGKSVQLHHMLQKDGEAIAEIAESLHQGFYKILHINPGSIPSGISRSQFNAWKGAYWKSRVQDFIGGIL